MKRKRIRKGNNVRVRWHITDVYGNPYDLSGGIFSLFVDTSVKHGTRPVPADVKSIEITEFIVSGNTFTFTFYGKDQAYIGECSLRFIRNDNEVTYDQRSAFEIVPHSWMENQGETTSIELETVELTSTINVSNDRVRPYMSLERLRHYLYKVTFDRLPEDNGGDSPIVGGCSSYVSGGKLYTNLDWDYDKTAEFVVRTKDFVGTSFIGGLNDGDLNDELIAQLPYRLRDGGNIHGIKVATHILYNDWNWNGCGTKSVNLTRLPFLILSRVKSMATIADDLGDILDNLYASDGLQAMDYLIQILITDGTTTYVLMPPVSDGESYILQDITECPKLANFRWVNQSSVVRGELQKRPTGVERWNMMPCDLSDLRFTIAYEQSGRLSEFIGLRDTTKYSTDEELSEIYADARELYFDRVRDGKTWHTMHSVVYGDHGIENLYIQENWNDDCTNQFGI